MAHAVGTTWSSSAVLGSTPVSTNMARPWPKIQYRAATASGSCRGPNRPASLARTAHDDEHAERGRGRLRILEVEAGVEHRAVQVGLASAFAM